MTFITAETPVLISYDNMCYLTQGEGGPGPPLNYRNFNINIKWMNENSSDVTEIKSTGKITRIIIVFNS